MTKGPDEVVDEGWWTWKPDCMGALQFHHDPIRHVVYVERRDNHGIWFNVDELRTRALTLGGIVRRCRRWMRRNNVQLTLPFHPEEEGDDTDG